MRDFFRWPFGKRETTPLVATQTRDSKPPAQSVDNQSRSPTVHVPDSGLTGDAAVSRYFELSGTIETAKAKGDFASSNSWRPRDVSALRYRRPPDKEGVGQLRYRHFARRAYGEYSDGRHG